MRASRRLPSTLHLTAVKGERLEKNTFQTMFSNPCLTDCLLFVMKDVIILNFYIRNKIEQSKERKTVSILEFKRFIVLTIILKSSECSVIYCF